MQSPAAEAVRAELLMEGTGLLLLLETECLLTSVKSKQNLAPQPLCLGCWLEVTIENLTRPSPPSAL